MLETIAAQLESIAGYAPHWGFVLVFVFMTIESSFIPFPSEVVMIPAGFLAYRGDLTTGNVWIDAALAFACGLAGSMCGAYVNYYLSLRLGRPFLHRYGKYFFLKEEALDRAEEVFRDYGDVATFVCRMLPAIRQLISIPAGLSRMHFGRFSLFTALGAGLWTAILLGIGLYFGSLAGDMTYLEMVTRGKRMISEHYLWIMAGLAAFVAAYALMHKAVMGGAKKRPASGGAPAAGDTEDAT